MIYSSGDIEQNRLKLVILSHFFAFLPTPPTALKTKKIKILKKQQKTARDIIILQLCTKNHNHTMYGS